MTTTTTMTKRKGKLTGEAALLDGLHEMLQGLPVSKLVWHAANLRRAGYAVASIADAMYPENCFGVERVHELLKGQPRCLRFRDMNAGHPAIDRDSQRARPSAAH